MYGIGSERACQSPAGRYSSIFGFENAAASSLYGVRAALKAGANR